MSEIAQNESDSRGRSRVRGYLQISVIAAIVILGIYFARAPSISVEKGLMVGAAAKPTVSVIRPVSTSQSFTLDLTGVVGLSRVARITPEVSARVVWVSDLFVEGGAIPAGATIVKLDPTDFERRVEIAKTNIKELEAAVWRERARGAHDARVFAEEHPNIEVSDRVQRLPSLAKREAELERAKLMLQVAEDTLGKTTITVPFSSRVLNSSVELGEHVGPAINLGSVYRNSALQVSAPIDVPDLARMAPIVGRTARVRTEDGEYSATVSRVSPNVAPQTRMATMFMNFNAADELPLPGTFANISIEGPQVDGVFVLPAAAEYARGRVWVVDNGSLVSVAPKTVRRSENTWLVTAFDIREGIVRKAVAGGREGLAVDVSSGSQAR